VFHICVILLCAGCKLFYIHYMSDKSHKDETCKSHIRLLQL